MCNLYLTTSGLSYDHITKVLRSGGLCDCLTPNPVPLIKLGCGATWGAAQEPGG